MAYSIGIDAGSKTIKLVVLDEAGSMVYHAYSRHRSNIKHTLTAMLGQYVGIHGNLEGSFAVTGSAGIAVAKMTGLPFVQEVIATTTAVQQQFPHADAFIELGGEDAKVVYLTGKPEQRMNATCAGGTGGFIDSIAYMLGVRTAEMDHLARRSSHVYPIASRCAVFAETDVRPLINAGASKEDLAASALEAIVRQTLGGLACGRPIRGTVVFLGGPLQYLPELAKRFRTALGLNDRTGLRPENAHLFTARGAALAAAEAADNVTTMQALLDLIAHAPDPEDDLPHLPPLFASNQEREEFRARHERSTMPRASIFESPGPLYLGLDAGSTTIKYALVNEEGKLVYSDYRHSEGNVLETALSLLTDLYSLISTGDAYLANSVVIGYGDQMLRATLRIDHDVVETVAHLRAAQALRPDVSFILDIGGQDMKALWVQDGQIVDAVLNEACSSGCGSFIEGTAYTLRMSPTLFSSEALSAADPLDLGTKCTVFMTSRVKHAQKTGAPRGNIAAGIAYSVVQNALHRVIGKSRIASMGNAVVVQGGTFKSDAVLRAFELLTGVEALRPDTAHLMGAIGAALIARDRSVALRQAMPSGTSPRSSIVSADELDAISPRYTSAQCTRCPNGCSLSLIDLGDGRVFVSGNQCPRGQELADEKIARLAARDEVAFAGLSRNQSSLALSKRRNRQGRSAAPRPGSKLASAAPQAGKAQPRPQRKVRIVMPTRGQALASAKGPNLMRLQQQKISASGPQSMRSGSTARTLGIIPTFFGEELLPFWQAFFSYLGFCPVPLPSVVPDAADGDPVCQPVRLTRALFAELQRTKTDYVFLPRYSRNHLCKSACLCMEELLEAEVGTGAEAGVGVGVGDGAEIGAGAGVGVGAPAATPDQHRTRVIAPLLSHIRPDGLARNAADLSELKRVIEEQAPEIEGPPRRILDAIRYALNEQLEFEIHIGQMAENALVTANETGHGLVLGTRPCHIQSALLSGLDDVVDAQGDPIITAFAFETYLNRRIASNAASTSSMRNGHVFAGRALSDSAWKQSERMLSTLNHLRSRNDLDVIRVADPHCELDQGGENDLERAFAEARRPFVSAPLSALGCEPDAAVALDSVAAANEQARQQRAAAPAPAPAAPAATAAATGAAPASAAGAAAAAGPATAATTGAAPAAAPASWSGIGPFPTRPPAPNRTAAKDVPNVVAFEQSLIDALQTVPPHERNLTVGLIGTLESYEVLPFWHDLFATLGFGVRIASRVQATAVKNAAAESVPSESVCEPAKLSHARLYQLREAGVDAVFLPRYERKSRCPILCGYSDVLLDSVEFLRDGSLHAVSPQLLSFTPKRMAKSPAQLDALFESCVQLAAREADAPALSRDDFDRAFLKAKASYDAFLARIQEKSEEALAWVHADPTRHGIVLAGRPYHTDPALTHRIDKVIQDLGVAVLAPLGLTAHTSPIKAHTGWKPSKHLLKMARFVITDPALHLVMLQSFGCGFDAVSLRATRGELTAAGHGFVSLKIDEIVDTAHIRIRLRTLIETIEARKAPGVPADFPNDGRSAAYLLPEFDEPTAQEQARALPLLTGPLDETVLDVARSAAPPDICFTAAALVARAVQQVRDQLDRGAGGSDGSGEPGATSADATQPRISLAAPRVCQNCITDALPAIMAEAVGPDRIPAITWENEETLQLAAPAAPAAPATGLAAPQPQATAPAAAPAAPSHVPAAPVRVGIVGNPLLCFDTYMNEGLAALLHKIGAAPVWPDPAKMYVDDVRYLDQLADFAADGVETVLYLQSFGCMKGHIQARGVANAVAERFPRMPVTVLDYDPESSALNRENRIRLAVAAARRARKATCPS